MRRLFVAVVGLHGGTCHLCTIAPATTTDHLVPRSKGGSDELPNLRPACSPCNSRRQARDLTDELRRELQERRRLDFALEQAVADLSPRFARRSLSADRLGSPAPPSLYLPEPQEKTSERTER